MGLSVNKIHNKELNNNGNQQEILTKWDTLKTKTSQTLNQMAFRFDEDLVNRPPFRRLHTELVG